MHNNAARELHQTNNHRSTQLPSRTVNPILLINLAFLLLTRQFACCSGGLKLFEVDRILRAGGFFVWIHQSDVGANWNGRCHSLPITIVSKLNQL